MGFISPQYFPTYIETLTSIKHLYPLLSVNTRSSTKYQFKNIFKITKVALIIQLPSSEMCYIKCSFIIKYVCVCVCTLTCYVQCILKILSFGNITLNIMLHSIFLHSILHSFCELVQYGSSMRHDSLCLVISMVCIMFGCLRVDYKSKNGIRQKNN